MTISSQADANSRPYDGLSFAGSEGELWSPVRSGNYADDCRLGGKYAAEAIAHMRHTNTPFLLGFICREFDGPSWSGVEVGFCAAIAEQLCRSGLQAGN
jgi:hypothetical protein